MTSAAVSLGTVAKQCPISLAHVAGQGQPVSSGKLDQYCCWNSVIIANQASLRERGSLGQSATLREAVLDVEWKGFGRICQIVRSDRDNGRASSGRRRNSSGVRILSEWRSSDAVIIVTPQEAATPIAISTATRRAGMEAKSKSKSKSRIMHKQTFCAAAGDFAETVQASDETGQIELVLKSGEIMKLVLRRGRLSDMGNIRKMLIPEVLNPFNLQHERFWVVDGGPEIGLVGICQFETIQEDPFLRELRSMVVIKEYRGQGIGTAMTRAVLDTQEKERPLHVVTAGDLNCKFYKKLGFKVLDENEVPDKLKAERLAAAIGGKLLGLGGGFCLRLD